MKRAERQPLGNAHLYGGVYVKEMLIPDAGTLVPTHRHSYGHISYVAAGAVRVWRDDVLLGEFVAPAAVRIEARAAHKILSLVDCTLVLCVHAVGEAEEVSIDEEHHLQFED